MTSQAVSERALKSLGPPSDCRVCIAIDFGTAGTGIAYALIPPSLNNKAAAVIALESLRVNPIRWPGSQTTAKTKTNLLLDANDRFIAFGDEAHDKYQAAEDTEKRQWKHFRRFKMVLHKIDDNEERRCTADNGTKLSAGIVFGKSLKAVTDYALDQVNAGALDTMTPSQVYWVLTVPAIWSYGANSFMREAIRQSNMSLGNMDKVYLAREPEAASVYCRKQYGEDEVNFPAGVQWCVIDCGAGTIDIVTHELNQDRKTVKEISKPPRGNDQGSTMLNKNIVDLIAEIVGNTFMQGDNSYLSNHSGKEWTKFLITVEQFKLSIRMPRAGQERNTRYSMELDPTINAHLRRVANTDLSTAVKLFNRNRKYSSYVDDGDAILLVDNKTLRIPYLLLLDRVYKPCLAFISQELRQCLNNTPGISYVFLVGNYAESDILYDCIKKTCAEVPRVKLVKPAECGLAIVIGAVYLGLSPLSITDRIMPHTFGIASNIPYSQQHREDRRAVSYKRAEDGVEYAEEFERFVHKGQSVKTSEIVSHMLMPIDNKQTSVEFNIYRTDKMNPSYVDEAGVEKCAEMSLNLGRDSSAIGWQKRPITVSMSFGQGSEFKVMAYDEYQGATCQVSVQFVKSQK